MPAKRRLQDLYVVGKDETFPDDQGEPITVWLQKLNPVESGEAMRKANAARARVLSVQFAPESDAYQALWLEVLEMGDRDALVTYLSGEPILRALEREEARLSFEEPWVTDGYLVGLKDAWEAGLEERHLLAPDEESERVWADLQRFAALVQEVVDEEAATIRASFEAKSDDELRKLALERVITYQSNAAWLDEMHKCELWKGVREPDDHSALYFATRPEVDALQREVLQRLLNAYAELSVDVTEGKGSEETPASSTSSASADGAATGGSSGQPALAP